MALLRALDVTVVLVTHDREEAFSIADRIALMREGTIVQEGSPEALYLSPASRWAAEFVGAGNFLPGVVHDGLVETPLGAFPANGSSGATAPSRCSSAQSWWSSSPTLPARRRWSAGSSAAMTCSTEFAWTVLSWSRTVRRRRRSRWVAAST